MTSTPRGLHESIITDRLASQLARDRASHHLSITDEALSGADAPERLASHVEAVIRRAILDLGVEDRAAVGTRLVREVVGLVHRYTTGDSTDDGNRDDIADGDEPVEPPRMLRQVAPIRPNGTAEDITHPLIPLLDTTLLTNAPGEPVVGRQIASELESADRVDIVMAFIRWSGVQPFEASLRSMANAGRPIRVLTTTYTGSTEARALELLRDIGADIRVSYDLSGTRLHAKAWIFHRTSGFSTAYIGSSNLTHQAQQTGLEWNVRISGVRNRGVVEKMAAVFDAYWESGDFENYDLSTFLNRIQQRQAPGIIWPTELRLQPFQEALLQQIELSRTLGYHRNLLVAATGTGKTVMAAVDYTNLRVRIPNARLLFIAHREEILEQARRTYQFALADPGFGELWVGNHTPTAFTHVFASIQTLHGLNLARISPKHFDIVVVDEFHHAAAASYQALLDHVQPRELLGLTATPERSDGLPILHWFGDRIAAELRLWDAISQQRLVPFVYFGITDTIADYTHLPWTRGRGYDVAGLSNLLTGNDAWAGLVISQVRRRSADVTAMRALGFCVSIDHARYMARKFSEAGIPSVAIWSDTPGTERTASLQDLRDGRINVVFSVDLFNEGVDVPTVDTLLMLRPTDSPVLFLQQLGRGLRLHAGKTHCLVLDFVGQHRREFRFDRRFQALLGGSRSDLVNQIQGGFPFLPTGCHMELDRIAQERVLANIRAAVPATLPARVADLRAFGRDVNLATYLEGSGLELDDVYANNSSWSDLRQRAGLPVLPFGPNEESLRRAIGRILHIDDPNRLKTYADILAQPNPPDPPSLDEPTRRLLRMLIVQLLDHVATRLMTLSQGCELLWQHSQVIAELREVIALVADKVTHVAIQLDTMPNVPLRIHASYARSEILAAFGVGDGAQEVTWREGVRWVPEELADVFVITSDKTTGQFSPTTRYRDYAITRDLFHWESQSRTSSDSPTGRRYRTHTHTGSQVMLFARRRHDDRAFLFLGPATYVTHTSDRPMQITWRLHHPVPPDLLAWLAIAS